MASRNGTPTHESNQNSCNVLDTARTTLKVIAIGSSLKDLKLSNAEMQLILSYRALRSYDRELITSFIDEILVEQDEEIENNRRTLRVIRGGAEVRALRSIPK